MSAIVGLVGMCTEHLGAALTSTAPALLPSLPGHLPDYACLIVGANMGVVGMCKEHLGVALALKVPAFFVVTKVDICPEHIMKQTVQVRAGFSIRVEHFGVGWTSDQESLVFPLLAGFERCVGPGAVQVHCLVPGCLL